MADKAKGRPDGGLARCGLGLAEMSNEADLLNRITVRPDVFAGKPIIHDMRIAVEHVLGMLAAGDTPEVILREYPMLEPEDVRACLCFAYRSIAGERVYERLPIRKGT